MAVGGSPNLRVLMLQPAPASPPGGLGAPSGQGANSRRCAAASITFGILDIAVGVVLFVYQLIRLGGAQGVGSYAGVWGGVFIFIAGTMTIGASCGTRRQGLVITSLVLSVISCIAVGSLVPAMMNNDYNSESQHRHIELICVLTITSTLAFTAGVITSITACVDICCTDDRNPIKYLVCMPNGQLLEGHLPESSMRSLDGAFEPQNYTSLERSAHNTNGSVVCDSQLVSSGNYEEIPDVLINTDGPSLSRAQPAVDYEGYNLMLPTRDDGSYLTPKSSRSSTAVEQDLPTTRGSLTSSSGEYVSMG